MLRRRRRRRAATGDGRGHGSRWTTHPTYRPPPCLTPASTASQQATASKGTVLTPSPAVAPFIDDIGQRAAICEHLVTLCIESPLPIPLLRSTMPTNGGLEWSRETQRRPTSSERKGKGPIGPFLPSSPPLLKSLSSCCAVLCCPLVTSPPSSSPTTPSAFQSQPLRYNPPTSNYHPSTTTTIIVHNPYKNK